MKQERFTSFSQYYEEKKQKKEISDASFAFIVPGVVLAAVFLIRAHASRGAVEALSIAAAVCGLALVVLGVFFPKQMVPASKKVSAFFNKIGTFLLRVLLVPVYFVMFITTFWYAKIKKKEYGFAQWDAAPEPRSTYFVSDETIALDQRKTFRVIGSIFAGLAARKLWLLLPLILLLLLIGLLFFFVSSSTVFSFIYTFV